VRAIEHTLSSIPARSISLPIPLQFVPIDGSHRQGQITEGTRVGKVQSQGSVVLQHPGKDIVHVRVVVSTTAELVQQHQVVEIRNETFRPFLSQIQAVKLLGRVTHHTQFGLLLLQLLHEVGLEFLRVEGHEAGYAVAEEELQSVTENLVGFTEEYLLNL
jgi:hypothetical protein